MRLIDDIPVLLDENELILILGGKLDSERARKIIRQHEELFEEAEKLARPQAVYDLYPVEKIEGDRLFLPGSPEPLKSELFPLLIPGARQAALGVVTIGEELESRATSYLSEGEHLQGLLLDSLGTLALEKASLHLYEVLKEEAERRGFQASTPLSPGQIDWNITDQRKIFSRLQADRIGIRLTETSLMIPKKSVSLLVGLGNEVETKKRVCQYCPLQSTCPARRVQDYRRQQTESGSTRPSE